MTTQPGSPGRPLPRPPNLALQGGRGVAPYARPQLTGSATDFNEYPVVWWVLALLIAVVIVASILSIV